MTKGIITDGIIPTISITPEKISLESIPLIHRKRFFNENEIDVLAHLLKDAKKILEIGCQNGRTAKAILSNRLDIIQYVGVDVPPGTYLTCAVQRTETPEKAGELALDDNRFTLILRAQGSHGLEQLFEKEYFDAVFIDGDHSYAAVVKDHLMSKILVRKGGIIIHHDYHNLGSVGVQEAIVSLHLSGEKFIHVAGTWIVYSEV